MGKILNILSNSIRLTVKELTVNKLRSALSLIGIAFGIFCIIGVLATVNSLEQNIQNEVKSLGSNTIYIDKWDYSGGPDKPWWKMRARPVMKYEEMDMIKQRSQLLGDAAFLMQAGTSIGYKDNIVGSGILYGAVESQINIQPINFETGRYISSQEFINGNNVCLLGYENATGLFGNAERALGKQVDVKGRKVNVIGVMKKEGKNFVGWDYDNCIMMPYRYARTIFDEENTNPIIIAKGKPNVTTEALSQELKGVLRQIRRLSPTQEDNFSLNSVEAFSKAISQSFVVLNIVGSIIGGISLIVGMFGIANIMFVTVKERTSVIGLKKAIGAKKSTILFEFLLEAAMLCFLGGFVGMIFVYIGTLVLTKLAHFPVFVSMSMIVITIIICFVVGIVAGIIPAAKAARLDPVVAIRS